MCCFAQPVDLVKDTQIFARLTGTGTQYVAYQMNYESDLPLTSVPVAMRVMG